MKENLRKSQGITVIALIITIIVLLILAAVTLGSVFGPEGLLKKADEIVIIHKKEQYREELQLIGHSLQPDIFREGLSTEEFMSRYREEISKDKLFEEARRIELIETTIFVETKEGWKYVIIKDKVEMVDEFPEIEKPDIEPVAPTYICVAYKYHEDTKEGVLSFYENEENASQKGYDKIWTNVDDMIFSVNWNETSGTFPPWLPKGADPLTTEQVQSIKKVVIEDVISPKSSAEYYFYRLTNVETIENLSNLKTNNVTSMKKMFWKCSSLKSVDVSGFDTQNVISVDSMFCDCINLKEIKGISNLLNNEGGSKVENINCLFQNCPQLTYLDLSNWKLTNLKDLMNYTFRDCTRLQTLIMPNVIDTSNVTSMIELFLNCMSLTSLNVSKFNTSNVTSMATMFSGCEGLTSLDVSKFDTSNVTNMDRMFNGCKSLTSLNVSNFNTSNTTNMKGMFSYCYHLTNIDVSNFNTSNVTSMEEMFAHCRNLTNLDVSNFRTENCTNMIAMFYQCKKLTNLNLAKFNTSNVTDMFAMFNECSGLTNLNLSNFDTSKVTSMEEMFSKCTGLKTLSISNFNTSNVKDMNRMFNECSGLTSLNLSNFDTSNVTKMEEMFWKCERLSSLDVSNFNTSKVTTMNNMFSGVNVESLDVSNFDTSNVTIMDYMFNSCGKLKSLDLSKFNTSKVTTMKGMFDYCRNLTSLNLSNFDMSKVTAYDAMFTNMNANVRITTNQATKTWITEKFPTLVNNVSLI